VRRWGASARCWAVGRKTSGPRGEEQEQDDLAAGLRGRDREERGFPFSYFKTNFKYKPNQI